MNRLQQTIFFITKNSDIPSNYWLYYKGGLCYREIYVHKC
jgi:hypothetical protein